MPDQHHGLLAPPGGAAPSPAANGTSPTRPEDPEKNGAIDADSNGRSGRGGAGRRHLAAWLRDDVSLRHADLPVLLCCAVSGLADSCAFNAGGVFVSMQTGNTIFLALGAAHLPTSQPYLWLKAITSIGAFWLGCFLFSRATRLLGPQRRSSLALSFLAQAIFMLVSAALAQGGATPSFALHSLPSSDPAALELGTVRYEPVVDETDLRILLPLGLLAFQFGGQIVASRALGFNEVPTNVLTSVYCDLLSDPKLFAPVVGTRANEKRNRRLAAVVLLIAGAVAGGWLQRSRAGMVVALWIAGGLKLVMAAAWLAWRAREKGRGGGG